MNKNELLNLKKQIESDYAAESAAVEILFGRFTKERETRSKAIFVAANESGKRPTQCAEDIIKAMSGDFTVSMVVIKMRQILGRFGYDFGLIARQVIHLMRNQGLIETVVPGKGSRSGVYKLAK